MDGDTNDITDEVEATPRWVDTLRWWDGPWLEKVPYYRPVTMSLFWTEYQIFGPQARVAITWTHRVFHLTFLLMLLGFFSAMFGLGRATLGIGLFALGWNAELRLPDGTDAFNCWKDQCDIWSALATVGTCWIIYRWSQNSTRKFWRDRRWWMALGVFVVGLFVKELGMLTPLFLIITLFSAGQLRQKWPALAPFFLLSLGFWFLRLWALGGWGNKTGSGAAWPYRFASQVLGWPSSLISGDGSALAMLGLLGILGALFWWRWKPENGVQWRFLSICAAILIFGAALAHRYLPSPLVIQISRYFISGLPFETLLTLIIGSGFWLMARQLMRGDKRMFVSWVWVFIGFLPLIVQPPTSPHVHYPIAPGWSLWLACGSFWLAQWLSQKSGLMPRDAAIS